MCSLLGQAKAPEAFVTIPVMVLLTPQGDLRYSSDALDSSGEREEGNDRPDSHPPLAPGA